MGAPLYHSVYRGAPPAKLYRTKPEGKQGRKLEFTAHEGQKELIRGRKRFNYVNCGRRFGKTTFGVFLLLFYAITFGKPGAWFSPSYKDLSEIWKLTKRALAAAGMIANKNEQLKQIELTNGA